MFFLKSQSVCPPSDNNNKVIDKWSESFAPPLASISLHMMHIQSSSKYAEELNAAAMRFGGRQIEILFVDNPARWAREGGANIHGNPVACALTNRSTKDWLVLVQESISEDRVRLILDGLEIFGEFGSEVAKLRDPRRFLLHLVLHEIAHLKHSWNQEHEADCDRWAFACISEIQA